MNNTLLQNFIASQYEFDTLKQLIKVDDIGSDVARIRYQDADSKEQSAYWVLMNPHKYLHYLNSLSQLDEDHQKIRNELVKELTIAYDPEFWRDKKTNEIIDQERGN